MLGRKLWPSRAVNINMLIVRAGSGADSGGGAGPAWHRAQPRAGSLLETHGLHAQGAAFVSCFTPAAGRLRSPPSDSDRKTPRSGWQLRASAVSEKPPGVRGWAAPPLCPVLQAGPRLTGGSQRLSAARLPLPSEAGARPALPGLQGGPLPNLSTPL